MLKGNSHPLALTVSLVIILVVTTLGIGGASYAAGSPFLDSIKVFLNIEAPTLPSSPPIGTTAPKFEALEAPLSVVVTLGNYPATPVQLGADATVTPDAVPTGTTTISASTNAKFTGTFVASPATGVVRVTNAGPAGVYPVTVKAFGAGGSTFRTFTLTVTSGSACATAIQFTSAPNVTVGTTPDGVAVGDFNNDGIQDIAVVNSTDATVSIRLGDGAGGFTSPAGLPVGVGATPQNVAVGDFNNDGNLDFATDNANPQTISIRLGNGDGTFTSPPDISTAGRTNFVAIGDVNNDGKLDLIYTGEFNLVGIRLGDGLGGFGAPTSVVVGTGPISIATGDFNNDGNLDFAASNINDNNVSIRLGDGAGGFTSPAVPEIGLVAGSGNVGLAIGDFNKDGNQDFAVANSTLGTVSIRLGNGAGAFTGTTNVTVGAGPRSVAIGDFNNDGSQDFAVANSSTAPGTVSVVFGNGATTPVFSSPTTLNVGNNPYSIAIGDFNHDGRQDLATANNGATTASIRLGGCLAPTSTTTAVSSSASSAVFGQAVTLTATVTASDASSVTGTVTFKDGASTIGSCAAQAISTNAATCVINSLLVGIHSITAVYNGDSTHAASPASPTLTQTVSKASTSVAVGTSGNPSVVGGSVTFTAAISVTSPGSGFPSGTVAFTDSLTSANIPGCTASTITGGAATCTTNALSQGSHTITGVYSGDSNFNSSSGGRTQVVNPAVATHLSVTAPSTTTAGQTFGVTVTALDSNNNSVTGYRGTVHFTTIDSGSGVTLPADYTFVAGDNGVHTFAGGAKLVTAGSQTITATDTTTAAITGTSNSITVNPAAATHFVLFAPASVTAGNAFTFTVSARDGFDNTAVSYAGTVAFTKSDAGAGSAVPPNYTFVAGDNGVHTFANAATLVTIGNQTITATDTGAPISGISNSISVAAANCAPQPTGMVSWWKFEGNGLDARGQNNGTLMNSPTVVAGKVGQAFSFDGSIQYVNVPDNPANSITGSLSIDAWINPTSVSPRQVIVSKYDAVANQASYYLGIEPGGAVRFVLYNDGGGVVFRGVQTAPGVITPGTFSHVAATFDTSGENMKIYVNGVDTSAAFIANSSVIPSIFDGTAPLRIGADNDPSTGLTPFGGIIDEVELFNKALSASEVSNIYNASTAGKCFETPASSGLVAWFPGDGDARDISGNGNNGIAGSQIGFATGKVGQAMTFTGDVNFSRVTVADSPSLDPTAQMGIEGWVYPTTDTVGTNAMAIILNKEIVGSTQFEMARRLNGGACPSGNGITTGHFAVYVNVAGLVDNCGGWVDGGATLPLNTWSHVAMTYTGTTLNAYVNGVLTNSVPGTGPIGTDNGSLRLGGRVANAETWVGNEDEISIYGRGLSASEIQSIFNAGVAGKYKAVLTPAIPNASSNAGGDATVTFGGVTVQGMTQQVPIDPTGYPALPMGQTALGLYYDVSTAATYTGGVKVCFHLPLVTTSGAFSKLRINHFNGTSWDDVTNKTAGPGGIDFTNRDVCTDPAKLSTISPFAIGSVNGTSAAGVTISGRVLAPAGGGLRNASVVMTGTDGVTVRVTTNAFGFYKFDDVQSGGSYIMGVESRHFRYGTRVVQITDSLADIDFTPIE